MEEYIIQLGVSGGDEAESAASATDALEDSLDAAASAADAASSSFEGAAGDAMRLAKSTDKAGDSAERAALNFGEVEGSLGKLGGPVGKIGQKLFGTADAFTKLGNSFSGAKLAAIGAAVGLGIVVVAAAAAIAAVVALAAKLTSMAISASDAANKTAVLRDAFTGSAAGAAELSASVASVAGKVPIAASEVAGLADDLWKAGKRGAELEEALLAASYEAAGLGKNPGPDLIARRMANLDVIGIKLKDSIAAIFAGPSTVDATGKFTKSLAGLTDLFGQNHSEGRALQKLLSVIVDPLIAGLTALVPLATAAFRGMIIFALDVAIAVVKAKTAIEGLIPESVRAAVADLFTKQNLLNAALAAGKWAAGLLIGSFVVVAGIIAAVVVVVGGLIAVFAALIIGIAKVAVAIGSAVVSGVKALAGLASAGAGAAKGMIDGLVGGIKAGVGPVVDAIKAMASSAVGAIKAALKIASPSKVFEGLGEFTGEGFAAGVDAQAATVQTSLEAMVMPPAIEPMQAADASRSSGPGVVGRAASSASSTPTIDLSGATFTFIGVRDAAEHGRAMIEDALTSILEGDAIAEGAA